MQATEARETKAMSWLEWILLLVVKAVQLCPVRECRLQKGFVPRSPLCPQVALSVQQRNVPSTLQSIITASHTFPSASSFKSSCGYPHLIQCHSAPQQQQWPKPHPL